MNDVEVIPAMTTPAPMPVRLIETKLIGKGALVAIVGVQVGKLILRDVQLFSSGAKVWVGLPSKPQIRDGQVVRGENGRALYQPVVELADRESRDRFQKAVILAFEAQHGPVLTLAGGAL